MQKFSTFFKRTLILAPVFGFVLITGIFAQTIPAAGDIIFNEYASDNNSTDNDFFELLVLAPALDLRGLRISDNELATANGAFNNGESVFVFGNDAYLSNVKKGTVIVVWATTNVGVITDIDPSDFKLSLTNGTGVTTSVDGLGGTANAGLSTGGESLYLYLPGPDGTSAGTDNIYLDFISWETDNAVAPTGLFDLNFPSVGDNGYFMGNTAAGADVAANWNIFDLANMYVSDPKATPGMPNPGQDLSGLLPITVGLSVSTNAATELAANLITVTATASAPVTGNQTVSVAVSGTGITLGDYALSGSIITIPSGQTTGSITFKVRRDSETEPTETATLTLITPSSGINLGMPANQSISITDNSCEVILRKSTATSTSGAEISAFDPVSKRVYTVAGAAVEFYVMDNNGVLTGPTNVPFGFSVAAGTVALPNSVAIRNGLVAVAYAVQNTTANVQLPGIVAAYDAATAAFLTSVQVGFLPDMITFSPDGTKLLTANEGEPNSYGQANSFDPEGSVTIISIAPGTPPTLSVQTAGFSAFNTQMATLKAQGVRIYGPGATVAQDLEPEYITFSGDGTKALVVLQENNAIAEVDIATATVTSIKPLGLKDHSAVGVTGLNMYPFGTLPVLGNTAAGQPVSLGGFSGLFFEGYGPNGVMKFATHTDRGPNGEPTGDRRPFMLPNFAPEIVRFEVNPMTNAVTITQRLQLKSSPGNLLTGLPNTAIAGATANSAYQDEVPVDLFNNVLPLDSLGADLEGVVVAADGTFWMVDEYRPAIYRFDANGVMMKRYVPQGTAAAAGKPAGTFGTEALPAVLAQRRQNRGFEAVAMMGSKVYAFVQSPLRNPVSTTNGTLNASKNIRIVELDTLTETTRQFVYIMDNPDLAGATNSRADKIGDAVAIGNGQILVVERDDDAIDSDNLDKIEKKIYRFNFGGATDISSMSGLIALPGGGSKSVDQMTAAEMASVNIVPIQKFLHVDLALAGYNTVEKVEGLALLDQNTLAVINDNDFGVAGSSINFTNGTFGASPNPENVVLGIIKTAPVNGMDVSDQDGLPSGKRINIQSWPVFGMYQPDAIASFNVGGQTYFITANEGDSRDYTGFSEERRVGAGTFLLDPAAYPNATMLKTNANLGRLQPTVATGDLDGDGDIDQIHALGARSFTIWNSALAKVFDSGDQLEQITAAETPATFNSDGLAASWDTRSDNKGPEPEAVATGVVNGITYAFVGSERTGDIFVYDVSNPMMPVFKQYIDNPADVGVESLVFIPANESPTGNALILVSAEVSRTVTVYEFASNVSNMLVTGNAMRNAMQGATTWYGNCDGLIARVAQAGANPISGAVNAKVWIASGQPTFNGFPYVKRHFEIMPAANAATATAKVTLYATQAEFNSFNTLATPTKQLPLNGTDAEGYKANLRVVKYTGTSSNGTGVPGTYPQPGVEIDPVDTDIVWNSTDGRWEISFDVTGFSGFFITNLDNSILPLTWLTLNASLNSSQQAVVTWKVDEKNVAKYQVEKSYDGRRFSAIGTVASKGNGINLYNFIEGKPLQGTAFFRVLQIDIDGSSSYSQMVKLTAASTLITAFPNPVNDRLTLSVPADKLNTVAILTDMHGRKLKEIRLNSAMVEVNLQGLPSGMYLIATGSGTNLKIMKQ
ncbi:MAG: T9SS C-terminal target domain-containing protein [Bacteroidetes bacterium]|nr:MAG: T9SS C-terminal target domain-containing protein [Bacteroidota bacterium]